MIVAALSPASHGDNFLGRRQEKNLRQGICERTSSVEPERVTGRSYGGRSLFTIGLLKHMRGFLSPRAHFDGRRVSSELILITLALRQQS